MSSFYENDDDVLQMIQQIKKITNESKRKFEHEIDYLVEDTKKSLISTVNQEKNAIKNTAEEKLNRYRENILKQEKNIKEKHRIYQKLKTELAEVANNYKNKIKDFYKETEDIINVYESEKKELETLEDREWKELNAQSIEILNKTKSKIYANKEETNEKLRKVLKSIL
ncbi:conserved Plasmodium protein, unknown function [Plasmodium chabaudi chabaudi]|uniref:Uncharacterized protein n=1 Tax=Plasmodium chabaudi chabaudi TaxID=31271 RepID=A0A1C6YF02_PLACU|nr:conserved Plasmodium protein, unknown function [Plasmodium chabaudi chabaudi]SCN60098.1 conserved Plasmodium protein, unknown function [Plasmodium chabaudi chabaudi]